MAVEANITNLDGDTNEVNLQTAKANLETYQADFDKMDILEDYFRVN